MLSADLSPRLRSRLIGLLLFLSLLSYPLSILWISLGGGGGGGGEGRSSAPPLWLLEEVGRVQEEPGLTDVTCSWGVKETPAPSEARAPPPSGWEPASGLYPACRRRSRLKMLSMLRASLRGLHAGRYLPEELDLDSLLVLSASQSWGLMEAEEAAAGW